MPFMKLRSRRAYGGYKRRFAGRRGARGFGAGSRRWGAGGSARNAFPTSRLVNAVSRRIPRRPAAIWQDFPVHSCVCWFNIDTGAVLYSWATDGGATAVSSLFANATVKVDPTGGPLGAAAGPVVFGFYFTGGDVIQTGVISSFDRFFLHSVTCKVTPVQAHNTGTMPECDVYAVADYDGVDVSDASVGQVQGRPMAVKETWNSDGPIRPLVITVKPMLTQVVYGGLSSAYATMRSWLSTNYYTGANAAQHYGLKVACSQVQYGQGGSTAPIMGVRFDFCYRIGLREMLGGTLV